MKRWRSSRSFVFFFYRHFGIAQDIQSKGFVSAPGIASCVSGIYAEVDLQLNFVRYPHLQCSVRYYCHYIVLPVDSGQHRDGWGFGRKMSVVSDDEWGDRIQTGRTTSMFKTLGCQRTHFGFFPRHTRSISRGRTLT